MNLLSRKQIFKSAPSQWRAACLEWLSACARLLPAEHSHELGILTLRSNSFKRFIAALDLPALDGMKMQVPGIGELAHPVGLAAGFDKDGRALEGLAALGFSFIEVGTVTPQPQPGQVKPRLFRLSDQRALINRMGFNSRGMTEVARNLRSSTINQDRIPLGVNVGKNANTPIERALDDYRTSINALKRYARYVVCNISSPNTSGLRELGNKSFLETLAAELGTETHRVWIKLDPDRSKDEFQSLVGTIADLGFQGVVLTNTHRVQWPTTGGLSGEPLAHMALSHLEWAHEVHQGRLLMIGCGGIMSGEDVFARIARGASAVQIYTSLVYRGPLVVSYLLYELQAALKSRGFQSAREAFGTFYS